MDKKEITEEMHLEKKWFEDAKNQTLETLPAFMNNILNGYVHDYGTICHAISACALAAAYAANNSDQGGITGFQASFVLWDFIRQWSYSSNRCGLRILDYDAMLYPGYADHYDKVISEEIWESLQEEAKKKLEQAKKNKEFASPNVVEHWRSIVDGKVPFGFRVGQD